MHQVCADRNRVRGVLGSGAPSGLPRCGLCFSPPSSPEPGDDQMSSTPGTHSDPAGPRKRPRTPGGAGLDCALRKWIKNLELKMEV